MDIGFIGLGNMGSAIAANLLKSGEDVSVWNRSAGPAERLVAQGARQAASPQAAFQAEVVFSMLANDQAVSEVILQSGALDGARPGAIHVCLTTLSVALALRLEALHGERGLGYVAAPVLGRPDVAAAGGLNVLAAGEAAAVAKVTPLLQRIGKAVWPLGEVPHKANVVKLACNFALASMIETLGEAGALVQAYDVEPTALFDVMTGTLFGAPAYKTYAELIAERRFAPAGFKMPLGLKDVRLALEAGEAKHTPLPIASLVRDHMLAAIAQGDADLDWSALALTAFRAAGLERRGD
jgi:3-hydroxyisobutyrate dehydrogenase-like beta-hydroxyacid dehydrogenase